MGGAVSDTCTAQVLAWCSFHVLLDMSACVCVRVRVFSFVFFFRRSLLLFSVTTYCYYPVYRNREHNAASFLFFFSQQMDKTRGQLFNSAIDPRYSQLWLHLRRNRVVA